MDMARVVASESVWVLARELVVSASAMELVVVSEEGRQVGAREVDPIALRQILELGPHHLQLGRALGEEDT